MKSWPSSLALRELRAHLGAAFVLASQAGIALVLGLSGPFGTFETLSTLPRLVYWAGIVFGTYGLGSAVTLLLITPPEARHAWPVVVQVLLGGVLVGIVAAGFLWAWSIPFFGWRGVFGNLPAVALTGVFVVSWIVLALRALYPQPEADLGQEGQPALLRRLPLEKRGALVAISATDHYVDVATEKGNALILMRLADAIEEAAPVPGLQVHRSHWVALEHILRADRRGDGAHLSMRTGLEIPVSRRHVPSLRAAGLLPRK